MQEKIRNDIAEILDGLGITGVPFVVEHPADLSHGDYATNVAMIAAKQVGKNPRELAEQIAKALEAIADEHVEAIEVAGPGFINIRLSHAFFEDTVRDIINQGENYGLLGRLKGEKTLIEFTDPNPFKAFHIGHMMANTVGEALCRIATWNGAEVKRAIYQGDIGLHVAMAVWGMVQRRSGFPHDEDPLEDKVRYISDSYAFGAHEYRADARAKQEIDVTNKMLYEKSNKELLIYYEKGRQWSLEAFEEIYKRLNTRFDFYFLESEVGPYGKEVVQQHIAKGVFEVSDGATIFPGEKYGLHTRVFINSLGIPTYEAKELGLAKAKAEAYPYERSIVITGNEQDGYFKVLLKAMEQVFPELAQKTTHISHGMLRLPSGKMSSRTGDVITAEDMLDDVRDVVLQKIADRDFDTETKARVADNVALAAVKYSILKQSPGKDIIFDFDKSLSFEGDSGPYLQYTATRARSLMRKAKEANIIVGEAVQPDVWEVTEVEKLLNRFPEVVAFAYDELAPQHLVTYLTELAGAFNSFYGNHQILNAEDVSSPYKVAITQAVFVTLNNGLDALGIPMPEAM